MFTPINVKKLRASTITQRSIINRRSPWERLIVLRARVTWAAISTAVPNRELGNRGFRGWSGVAVLAGAAVLRRRRRAEDSRESGPIGGLCRSWASLQRRPASYKLRKKLHLH